MRSGRGPGSQTIQLELPAELPGEAEDYLKEGSVWRAETQSTGVYCYGYRPDGTLEAGATTYRGYALVPPPGEAGRTVELLQYDGPSLLSPPPPHPVLKMLQDRKRGHSRSSLTRGHCPV